MLTLKMPLMTSGLRDLDAASGSEVKEDREMPPGRNPKDLVCSGTGAEEERRRSF